MAEVEPFDRGRGGWIGEFAPVRAETLGRA